MKKLIYSSTLFLLLGLFGTTTLLAHDGMEKVDFKKKKEFTKSIKKEFDISADGLVGLTNKYGKVEVKTWDQNRVKVDVLITVNAGSEDRANESFDRIKIEFSNQSDWVKAETQFESQKKSWISSWWDSDDGANFTIDYEVHMPGSCDLELSNKYGHSTVAKMEGKATVVAKYGDVSMEGVDDDLSLNIGYGNATVASARDAKVIIKYGKLRLEDVRDVNLESKYSKVYISKAGDLETISKYDTYRLGEIREIHNQGKYDDFEIERAENVDAHARYSDFNINHLLQRGHFQLEYGDLHIDALASNFSKVEVESRYTGISIDVEDGASFELDVKTDHAGIHYPSGANIQYDVDRGSSHEVRGVVGSDGSKSLIHVRAEYGNVKVK